MRALNFNLRRIPPEVMFRLKHEAQKSGVSVNGIILKFISKGLGYSGVSEKILHHDLDHLAGTWTKKDLASFLKNTVDFEKIDKDLWE